MRGPSEPSSASSAVERTQQRADATNAEVEGAKDVGAPAAEEEAAAGPDPSARLRTWTPASATRRPYRPGHTLPLRVELSRQLRRRRTQVLFALVVLLPVLLWVAFVLAPDGPPAGSLRLVDLATSSGVNFAVFALFASSSFLLVVVVALFFGDTVAAEASWSSLRYLLAADPAGPVAASEGPRLGVALADGAAPVADRRAGGRHAGLRRATW